MQDQIKILKVKLIKGGEKVDVQYEESGAVKSSTEKLCDVKCHDDLVQAVQGLSPHLAVLTGYVNQKDIRKADLLSPFTVNGYSIGGKEGEEGFMILGSRSSEYGSVTLNSPFQRFEASEGKEYILIGDLQSKIAKIVEEVMAYLKGEKKAVNPQGSFDFPDEKVTHLQILPPEEKPFPDNLDDINPDGGSDQPTDDQTPKPKRKRVPQSKEFPDGLAPE